MVSPTLSNRWPLGYLFFYGNLFKISFLHNLHIHEYKQTKIDAEKCEVYIQDYLNLSF